MTDQPPPDPGAPVPLGPPPAGQPPLPSYPAAPPYGAGPPGYPTAAPAFAAAPGPAPGFVYAGFGARFLGYLVDQILLFVVEAVITVPFIFLPIVRFYQDHPVASGQPLPTLPTDLSGRIFVLSLIGAMVSALYYGGLVAWQGRTLGQRVVGTRVVRAEDGGRLPAGRAFLRAAIFWGPGLLSVFPFVGSAVSLLALIGLLAVAWDPRKQGWHDKLARSFVVKAAPVYSGFR
jgi:uncharacterized RDD family membrane protein YckC